MEIFRFGSDWCPKAFIKEIKNDKFECFNVHGKKSNYGFAEKGLDSLFEDANLTNVGSIYGIWHSEKGDIRVNYGDFIETSYSEIAKIIPYEKANEVLLSFG